MVTVESVKSLSIMQIAAIIDQDWNNAGKIYATNHIIRLKQMYTIKDSVGADKGDWNVAYFLANASTWKGNTARIIKAELKRRLKEYEKEVKNT
ncbi:hypothetical protein [Ralstonia phage RP13]|nr:hypothetical protein [Ralstonia phage RP13]